MSFFHELAHQEWLIAANFAAEEKHYKVGCGLGAAPVHDAAHLSAASRGRQRAMIGRRNFNVK